MLFHFTSLAVVRISPSGAMLAVDDDLRLPLVLAGTARATEHLPPESYLCLARHSAFSPYGAAQPRFYITAQTKARDTTPVLWRDSTQTHSRCHSFAAWRACCRSFSSACWHLYNAVALQARNSLPPARYSRSSKHRICTAPCVWRRSQRARTLTYSTAGWRACRRPLYSGRAKFHTLFERL